MKKTERIQFRISKTNKDFIQKKCKKEKKTISELMIQALFLAYGLQEKP